MSTHSEAIEHVDGATTKTFLTVWFALLFMTGVEVLLAYEQIPVIIFLTALVGLSVIKAALIIAYFMHLKFEKLSLFLTLIPDVDSVHHPDADHVYARFQPADDDEAAMKRVALALFLPLRSSWAQCVMCYRTAAAQNAARAHLLNMGIVLLGLPPFCILGGFIFLAWRRNQAFAATHAQPEPTSRPDQRFSTHVAPKLYTIRRMRGRSARYYFLKPTPEIAEQCMRELARVGFDAGHALAASPGRIVRDPRRHPSTTWCSRNMPPRAGVGAPPWKPCADAPNCRR